MQWIEMSDYNRGARVYWWMTTLVGTLAVGGAVASVVRMEQIKLLEVLALMLVVYVAGLRPIRIPSTQSVITPGDIFIFLSALFFGAPAATLVAVTDVFGASCRISRRWTSRIGSLAMMAIAIFISATFFEREMSWLHAHGWSSNTTMLGALLLFALVHFFLNTFLMAFLLGFKKRTSPLALWRENYLWASVTYTASASAAGIIYLAIQAYGISSLLAAGPLVAVIFATCHFYFKQADERARASERISRMHLATVEALATAIDAKDEVTHDHVFRVQVYAAGLARHFGLTDMDIEALKAGALLHDVGKIAVPDYILNKPGKLTAAEFEKMKIHTIVGAQILERVNFPYPVVPIVRHHHERWDGKGYPDGLKGEHIPMTARILTVVDCFDAVREDRQYRKGMTRDEACGFLRDNASKQFDPRVVEAFLSNLPEYEKEIVTHKASQQPLLTPTTQAGMSASGRDAVPAAGLAQMVTEPPDYVKQIHAAHKEVAALYEMAQTFSASLDVRDVVTLMVNRIERMIPFTTCAVYLREPDDVCVAAHVFGQNAEQIRGRRLAVGHGIAGWVVINGRAMTNTDPMLDLGEFLSANETGYRTAAVYPLMSGDETIGALALYTNALDSYGLDHLHLLESIAQLVSPALQHTLLHEQRKASAQTDALTGLANGRALYAQFAEDLAQAQDTPLMVLSFNLAGMRTVNDTFGYQTGDQVLAEVAGRLRQAIGEAGMLSRIAGDEFICLLKGYSRAEAHAMGERARAEFATFKLEARPGQFARVGLNFGLAECPADGQTIDELLIAATVATRQNKIAGYQPPLTKESPLMPLPPLKTATGPLSLQR